MDGLILLNDGEGNWGVPPVGLPMRLERIDPETEAAPQELLDARDGFQQQTPLPIPFQEQGEQEQPSPAEGVKSSDDLAPEAEGSEETNSTASLETIDRLLWDAVHRNLFPDPQNWAPAPLGHAHGPMFEEDLSPRAVPFLLGKAPPG